MWIDEALAAGFPHNDEGGRVNSLPKATGPANLYKLLLGSKINRNVWFLRVDGIFAQ